MGADQHIHAYVDGVVILPRQYWPDLQPHDIKYRPGRKRSSSLVAFCGSLVVTDVQCLVGSSLFHMDMERRCQRHRALLRFKGKIC